MMESLPHKGQQVDFFLQERADMVGLKIESGEALANYRSRVAGALRAKDILLKLTKLNQESYTMILIKDQLAQ